MHIPFDEQKIGEVSAPLLKRYDAVILADVEAMSDTQCEMLDSFVEKGGTLIADGCSSMSDERRQPRKHMGLQCLGMDEITEKKKVRSAIFQFSDAEKEALMSSKKSR